MKNYGRLLATIATMGFATSVRIDAAHRPLHLSDASSGQTISAVVGEVIHIDLSANLVWSEVDTPQSMFLDSSKSVLNKLSSTTTTDGAVHAAFKVIRAGQARVQATGHARCEAMSPCPMFILQWSVLLTAQAPFR